MEPKTILGIRAAIDITATALCIAGVANCQSVGGKVACGVGVILFGGDLVATGLSAIVCHEIEKDLVEHAISE